MAHQIAVSSSPLLRAVKKPAFPSALLAAETLLGAALAATLRRRRFDVVPAELVLAVAAEAAAAALEIDCAAHMRLVALSFAHVETTGALAQKSSRASIMSTR